MVLPSVPVTPITTNFREGKVVKSRRQQTRDLLCVSHAYVGDGEVRLRGFAEDGGGACGNGVGDILMAVSCLPCPRHEETTRFDLAARLDDGCADLASEISFYRKDLIRRDCRDQVFQRQGHCDSSSSHSFDSVTLIQAQSDCNDKQKRAGGQPTRLGVLCCVGAASSSCSPSDSAGHERCRPPYRRTSARLIHPELMDLRRIPLHRRRLPT